MKITVEISMYPFKEDYIPSIQAFIDKLNTYDNLRVKTTPTSTMVIGELNIVMTTLTEMLQWSYEQHGRAVYVTKFIPDYDPSF